MRAARAHRVFCTDEKHIRTEHTVIVNNKDSAVVLYNVAALQEQVGAIQVAKHMKRWQ
ncbi:MAG: hypothetical protein HY848_20105 [Betaproteobacteria bacterium]|nr:hypothetical protein [Betaproteobacteria bacterium]